MKRIFSANKKSANSRVFLNNNDKNILRINNKCMDLNSYFDFIQLNKIFSPIQLANINDKFFTITVRGGGKSGQADASKLALSRCIIDLYPDLKKIFKVNKLLTVDHRKVESKRYGRLGSRRGMQKSKR